jgi:hypothetical protein
VVNWRCGIVLSNSKKRNGYNYKTTTSDVGNQVNDAAPAQSAPKQSATTGSSTPYVELVGEAGNRPEGV